MKLLLALAIIMTICFFVIIIKLLINIRALNAKSKYVDEANMWHRLAVTDDLTGVYNRNAYNIHIGKTRKNSNRTPRAIMLFDVNGFKLINDTQGHQAGDAVLKKIADILLLVFTEPHYKVFRIGGDEFAVISEGVCEEELINRLITLEMHLNANNNISLAKGYSLIKNNPEKAFRYADEMLYADKMAKHLQHDASTALNNI